MFGKDVGYVSETTLFLRELLAKNPEIAKGQLEGRALLWDKPIDILEVQDENSRNLPQKPYVYQSN